jgi:hypothetical protein
MPKAYGNIKVRVRRAVFLDRLIEGGLAGVAEGSVANIVAESNRFGQIFVQPQGPRNRAGNLSDFQRMSKPRSVMIAAWLDENLGFVLQPPERLAVKDAVPISLKARANEIVFLRTRSTHAF